MHLYVCVRVCAGYCGQYLRGGVGHHQTGHVLWDQCVTSSATAPHLQSHQVKSRSYSLAHTLVHMYMHDAFPSAHSCTNEAVMI